MPRSHGPRKPKRKAEAVATHLLDAWLTNRHRQGDDTMTNRNKRRMTLTLFPLNQMEIVALHLATRTTMQLLKPDADAEAIRADIQAEAKHSGGEWLSDELMQLHDKLGDSIDTIFDRDPTKNKPTNN